MKSKKKVKKQKSYKIVLFSINTYEIDEVIKSWMWTDDDIKKMVEALT